MKSRAFYTIVLFIVILFGCSSEKNTWTAKSYHNLTAHYNGYYYALDEINKIEASILASNLDDYNRILRLFPSFDSSMAKGYDKEAQEAIKMASIAIQRHPNSKWVDDAYILVGKARMYTLDWGNAIETFKYVNGKSEDPHARHKAIINLIRTFVEHQEFNNAQAAIDYLAKEKLSKTNAKDFYLIKAYFHQTQEDYDNMVRSLTMASPLLKKSDRSGRIYFIIGQVYQELGFESEAFNYYRKCLATNPEYETDFYARLYMAQVAEISRSRDLNAARKSFKRLLKDRKNKEFKDKIYFEMGAFELKQKNLDQAITDFNLAIREGSNSRVDGEAYLSLGEIYYDTLRKYELSQAYYDSAIGVLPTDFENYAQIKARQETLNEFVKNLKTIEWQDSLLSMVSLDSAALRNRIDSVFKEKKRLEELAQGKKKKRKSNRIEIESTNTNIFDTGETTSETTSWYFGNPSAMAIGESEFRRVWGDIALEDDWRRSQKISNLPSGNNEVAAANTGTENANVADEAKPVDPVEAQFEVINKQIPRTEEQKAEALKKIEDAYFRVGDIYYFDLMEKDNAALTYKKLLERFPESEYSAEVLYKLYLIYKDSDAALSDQYATLLKEKYPTSSFAKILINPDYLKESSETLEKQKSIYKTAYSYYEKNNFVDALQGVNDGINLGQTAFSDNLELLKVMIIGRTESIETYRSALTDFIQRNPDSELVEYATKLQNSSSEFEKYELQKKNMPYIRSTDGSHYFVIIYKTTESVSHVASSALESFNKNYFAELNLKTSNLELNELYGLTIVSEFTNSNSAQRYYKTFSEKLLSINELRNHNFNKFVISTDNFNIFYRTKGLNEYLQFFEKNYPAQTP